MFTPTSEIFGFSLDDGLFGRIREQRLSGNDNLLATMTEVVIQNNLGRLDQWQAATCDLDDFVTNLENEKSSKLQIEQKSEKLQNRT